MTKHLPFLALLFVLAAACHAQTVVQQADSDVYSGAPSPISDHPNMTIASNGTYVMTQTFQNVNIYNVSDLSLQSTTAKATFLTNAGCPGSTGGGESRLIYDPFNSRWIMVAAAQPDFMIVSSGSDPTTSTWKCLALSANSGDLLMQLGFDKNWVYVSEFLACSGANAQRLIAIPTADVAWSGGGTISLTHEVIDDCHTYDAIPIRDLTASKGLTAPGYFISRVGEQQGGGNVALTLTIDTFTPSTATAGTFNAGASPTTIATGWVYNAPKTVNQPGSPGGITSGESHRPFTFMTVDDNTAWVAWGSGNCHTSCPVSQGIDSNQLAFFFQINIPALTLNQKLKWSDGSLGFLFPALALDSSGNMVATATGCSTTQFCSLYSIYQLTTDTAGTFHGPNLVTAGTQNYQQCPPHGTPPGWGDYADAAQDPSTPSRLWFLHEYANSATPCDWFTHIVEYQPAATPATPTSIVPASQLLARVTR